jgi:hypothetical protein
MPQPHKGESQKEYMNRCMGESGMVSKYPKADQRAAVCHSLYRSHGDKKSQAQVAPGAERGGQAGRTALLGTGQAGRTALRAPAEVDRRPRESWKRVNLTGKGPWKKTTKEAKP